VSKLSIKDRTELQQLKHFVEAHGNMCEIDHTYNSNCVIIYTHYRIEDKEGIIAEEARNFTDAKKILGY